MDIHTDTEARRPSKTLAYLQDYYCNMIASDIPYPLCVYMSYEKLSDEYKTYILALTQYL